MAAGPEEGGEDDNRREAVNILCSNNLQTLVSEEIDRHHIDFGYLFSRRLESVWS